MEKFYYHYLKNKKNFLKKYMECIQLSFDKKIKNILARDHVG